MTGDGWRAAGVVWLSVDSGPDVPHDVFVLVHHIHLGEVIPQLADMNAELSVDKLVVVGVVWVMLLPLLVLLALLASPTNTTGTDQTAHAAHAATNNGHVAHLRVVNELLPYL